MIFDMRASELIAACVAKTASAAIGVLMKILMINLSKEPFTFNDGERIAQMVVARHEVVERLIIRIFSSPR